MRNRQTLATAPTHPPLRPWQSSGVWTCVLAGIHVATTGVFYPDSVRSIRAGKVIGSVDAADPELKTLRGGGFWYATAGLALGYIGATTALTEKASGHPTPGFAGFMTAMGAGGVLLAPTSGFWLFFPIAALAHHHRDRGAPPAPSAVHTSP